MYFSEMNHNNKATKQTFSDDIHSYKLLAMSSDQNHDALGYNSSNNSMINW